MAIKSMEFPTCYQEFRNQIERILNETGLDAHSGIPDYILADMLTSYLLHFDIANARARKAKS